MRVRGPVQIEGEGNGRLIPCPSDDGVLPVRIGQHPIASPLCEGASAARIVIKIFDQELVEQQGADGAAATLQVVVPVARHVSGVEARGVVPPEGSLHFAVIVAARGIGAKGVRLRLLRPPHCCAKLPRRQGVVHEEACHVIYELMARSQLMKVAHVAVG